MLQFLCLIIAVLLIPSGILYFGEFASLLQSPQVFEKLQGLTWQFLHDGPRTLRATEMRLALGRATLPEQALLRDREDSLCRNWFPARKDEPSLRAPSHVPRQAF